MRRVALVVVLSWVAVVSAAREKTTVWMHVTVTDAEGRLVMGLGRDQFVIEAGGENTPVTEFVKDEHPVAISLMLDISGSMANTLPDVQRAAETLIEFFITGDRVNVGTFRGEVTLSARFTANRRIILQSIHDAMFGGERICTSPSKPPPGSSELQTKVNSAGLPARGGTWMWDAVECGVNVLADDGEAFRRILLLVTDGVTNGGYGTEASARRRANDAGVLVYATGLVGTGGRNTPLLQSFTKATGGWYVPLEKGQDYTPIFRRIGEELHNQYVLAFETTPERAKSVTVSVKTPDLKVRAQRGRVVRPR